MLMFQNACCPLQTISDVSARRRSHNCVPTFFVMDNQPTYRFLLLDRQRFKGGEAVNFRFDVNFAANYPPGRGLEEDDDDNVMQRKQQ